MQWLEANAHETRLSEDQRSPESFIPRQVFSQYLKSLLKESAAQNSGTPHLSRVQGEAIRAKLCSDGDGGTSVRLLPLQHLSKWLDVSLSFLENLISDISTGRSGFRPELGSRQGRALPWQ